MSSSVAVVHRLLLRIELTPLLERFFGLRAVVAFVDRIQRVNLELAVAVRDSEVAAVSKVGDQIPDRLRLAQLKTHRLILH